MVFQFNNIHYWSWKNQTGRTALASAAMLCSPDQLPRSFWLICQNVGTTRCTSLNPAFHVDPRNWTLVNKPAQILLFSLSSHLPGPFYVSLIFYYIIYWEGSCGGQKTTYKSVLSSHYVNPKDQTEGDWLGDKCSTHWTISLVFVASFLNFWLFLVFTNLYCQLCCNLYLTGKGMHVCPSFL